MAKSKKIKIGKDKKKILIIGAVVIVLLVGISSAILLSTGVFKDKASSNPNKENLNNNEEPEEKELQIVDINSKSRPYAIMINNINVARPYQSGLQDAYLIYEMIVEGGITRYLALFKDQTTSRIGTVRSSRHYYLDYALENDAYYVHWGWSDQAKSDISTLKINNINGLYDNAFWKDNTLNVATEHRAYTSIEKLEAAVASKKYRTETNQDLLLNYSVDELDLSSVDNFQVANNVSIKYSSSVTSSYTYDAENGYYLRSVNGEKHTDYVTKEQYHFKNIITYQVKNYTISGDTKGRQELDNIGSGTGYYISNGYAVPIKWVKESRASQTKYYYENGEELIVNDGNTFIQIQPKGQTLTIE